MAKPEWGLKRMCLSCGAKFYDLQRDPILCPSCGTQFDPEAAVKLKRGRPVVSEEKKKVEKSDGGDVELLETDDIEDDIDDDDEDVLEDTSDLDDGDDVPVVGGGSDGDDGDDS